MQSHQLGMLSQSKDKEWKAIEWEEVISKVTEAPELDPVWQTAVLHLYCLTKQSVTRGAKSSALTEQAGSAAHHRPLVGTEQETRSEKQEQSLSRLPLTT